MFGRGALKRFRPFGAGASSSSASALAASAAAAAGLPPVAAIAAAAAPSLSSLSSPAHQRRRDAGGSSASASSAAAAEPSGSGSIKRRKFGSSAQAAILESTDRAIRQQREREQQAARARSTFEDEMDPDERQEYVRNKNRAQSEFRKRFRERAAREGRVPANGERWTDEEYAQAVDDEAALWFANRRAEQADQNQRRGIVPEDERAPADVPMLEEVGAVANADALDAEVDELFGAMLAKTAEQCDEAKQRMRLSTATQLSTDLLRDVRQCAGDLTMDAIARALNNMGCVRSEFQAMFHDAFTQACLPMSVQHAHASLYGLLLLRDNNLRALAALAGCGHPVSGEIHPTLPIESIRRRIEMLDERRRLSEQDRKLVCEERRLWLESEALADGVQLVAKSTEHGRGPGQQITHPRMNIEFPLASRCAWMGGIRREVGHVQEPCHERVVGCTRNERREVHRGVQWVSASLLGLDRSYCQSSPHTASIATLLSRMQKMMPKALAVGLRQLSVARSSDQIGQDIDLLHIVSMVVLEETEQHTIGCVGWAKGTSIHCAPGRVCPSKGDPSVGFATVFTRRPGAQLFSALWR